MLSQGNFMLENYLPITLVMKNSKNELVEIPSRFVRSENIQIFCQKIVIFHILEDPNRVTYYLYSDALYQQWLNSSRTFSDYDIQKNCVLYASTHPPKELVVGNLQSNPYSENQSTELQTERPMESGTGFINLMFEFKLPENIQNFTFVDLADQLMKEFTNLERVADQLMKEFTNLERVEINDRNDFQSVLPDNQLAHIPCKHFFLRFTFKRSPSNSVVRVRTPPSDQEIGTEIQKQVLDQADQADPEGSLSENVYINPTAFGQTQGNPEQ